VFPLFYNSHFEQISDGLNPNQISIKNIDLLGRFDYDFLKVIIAPPTIVPIVEPTSSPTVSKTTIDSEYKRMAFAYTTGTNHTQHTITFPEERQCDIFDCRRWWRRRNNIRNKQWSSWWWRGCRWFNIFRKSNSSSWNICYSCWKRGGGRYI